MKIYRIEAETSDDSSGHIDISDFFASREMAEKALNEYNERGRQSRMWRYYDPGAYIEEYELVTNELWENCKTNPGTNKQDLRT